MHHPIAQPGPSASPRDGVAIARSGEPLRLTGGAGRVAYLPPGAPARPLPDMPGDGMAIMPWPVDHPLPADSCLEPVAPIEGWVMTAALAARLGPALDGGDLALSRLHGMADVRWLASRAPAARRRPTGGSPR